MTTPNADPAGQPFIDGLRAAAKVGTNDHTKHVYSTYADFGEAQNRMAEAAEAFAKLSGGEMHVILAHRWGAEGGWTAIDGKWPMQEGGAFGVFAHGRNLPEAVRGLAEVLDTVDPRAESIRRIEAKSGLPAFIQ